MEIEGIDNMKKLLLSLIATSSILLTGCFGSKKVSFDRFQQEVGKIQYHEYSTATIKYERVTKTTGTHNSNTPDYKDTIIAYYHKELNRWLDKDGYDLSLVVEPHTLYGLKFDENMPDSYSFYINPLKVVQQTTTQTPQFKMKATIEMKYGKYGYISAFSYVTNYKTDDGTTKFTEKMTYSYK